MVKLDTPLSSTPEQHLSDGRARTVIETVSPEIDGGRFPIKRVSGDAVGGGADMFADGHDAIACAVLFRRDGASDWERLAMEPLVNDRWRGAFSVPEPGTYRYTFEAWVDHFASWRSDLRKRADA